METKVDLKSRVEGAIYGLLIGDALGVPYEFHDASALPFTEQIEFEPPTHFRRSHAGVPAGTWSDDGAQALILLHSLLECGRFDAHHFAQGLVAWYDHGFMAVDDIVFDVGIQTRESIAEIKKGVQAKFAGGVDEYSNGNGSLMRCLPMAIWHTGPDEELIDLAYAQSAVTHGHIRSKLCCALYCLWARGIFHSKPDPWDWAVDTLSAQLQKPELEELRSKIDPANRPQIVRGSGYVVDCLHAARWASERSNYESAVRSAILLGADTDTTACVTGGIVGLMNGVDDIPIRWRDSLRGKAIVEPLLSELVALLSKHFR